MASDAAGPAEWTASWAKVFADWACATQSLERSCEQMLEGAAVARAARAMQEAYGPIVRITADLPRGDDTEPLFQLENELYNAVMSLRNWEPSAVNAIAASVEVSSFWWMFVDAGEALRRHCERASAV